MGLFSFIKKRIECDCEFPGDSDCQHSFDVVYNKLKNHRYYNVIREFRKINGLKEFERERKFVTGWFDYREGDSELKMLRACLSRWRFYDYLSEDVPVTLLIEQELGIQMEPEDRIVSSQMVRNYMDYFGKDANEALRIIHGDLLHKYIPGSFYNGRV